MTEQKLKTLAAQRDEIEMIQIQLKSCVEFVRESLRIGSQGEVVNMKKPVVTMIKKLTADLKPDALKTTIMKFTAASLPIQQFGKMYLQQLSPEKCYVSTKGMLLMYMVNHVWFQLSQWTVSLCQKSLPRRPNVTQNKWKMADMRSATHPPLKEDTIYTSKWRVNTSKEVHSL